VLSFPPVVRIGTPPTPHPQASVPPPPLCFRGEWHTRWRERGSESPNSDEWYTVVLFTFMYFMLPLLILFTPSSPLPILPRLFFHTLTLSHPQPFPPSPIHTLTLSRPYPFQHSTFPTLDLSHPHPFTPSLIFSFICKPRLK
jgi:hypothetical protein